MAMTDAQIKESLNRIASALDLGSMTYRIDQKGSHGILVLHFEKFKGKNMMALQKLIDGCTDVEKTDKEVLDELDEYLSATISPDSNRSIGGLKTSDFWFGIPGNQDELKNLEDAAKKIIFRLTQ